MTDASTPIQTDTGPFAIVPEWLLDAEISDRAVRLYALLGRYADASGAAFPRRRTLARRLQCSVDSVDRAMKQLIDVGALMAEHRFEDDDDGSRQTSNAYLLLRAPGRTTAAGGGATGAAPPGRTGAAPGTRTTDEREPVEREEPAAAVATVEYDPRKGKRIGERNLPFDALAEATGANPDSEGGRIARALQKIRGFVVDDFISEAADGAHETLLTDPERYERQIGIEIWARRQAYIERWPGAELTPTALANNWHRVVAPRPGGDPLTAEQAAQQGIDAARGAS